VIKQADHVIDLGPEGGAAGGSIVFAGTPEALAREERSHTGRYLSKVIAPRARPAAASPKKAAKKDARLSN
jgi:excinuclease ABC subunit A